MRDEREGLRSQRNVTPSISSSNDLSPMLDSPPSMVPSSQHSIGIGSHTFSFLLALLFLVSAACGTQAQSNKILFEDPQGTVFLQKISDPSIQATHPINLDPALLARVLQGIEVQNQEYGFQKLFSGSSSSVPVFSDDQIHFLAPLLAEGLRKAAPDETVGYRVHTTQPGSLLSSSTTETTSGSLYAYGRQLNVTLSQYQSGPMAANKNVGRGTAHPRPPDFSGLRDRNLLFTPKAAQRSESFDPPAGGKPTDRFLAIDYALLQQTSPDFAAPEQTAPQMGHRSSPSASSETTEALAQREAEIQALRDRVNRNASEMETLRKELQSVQEQLGSPTAKPDSQKRKSVPPAGSQLPFVTPAK
jgi:hypothetical protein